MSEIGSDGTAKVRTRRRYWTKEEKLLVVAECKRDDSSIAEVARRHGINANLVFTWRRQFGVDRGQKDVARLVPVTVAPPIEAPETTPSGLPGRMEITLPGGERIVVGADVDAAALARVAKALSRR